MTQLLWTDVDRYITDSLVASDPILDAVLESSATAGLRPINVAANQGKLLMLLALVQKARRILEIGTLGGYSTIWLARALPSDGRVVTLEISLEYAKIACNNFANAGLANKIDLFIGKALDTLPQLAEKESEPFDMVFIDADKPNNLDYFKWALKLSRPGSLIIVDNVIRNGAVIDAKSTDKSVQGVRRLNEFLSSDSRITATTIQTVGSKGYDGFTMAYVLK